MDAAKIVELLNHEPEMDADLHDGSYELMRSIVESYSTITDYSVINYVDLDAIYAMVIGNWRLNVEKKKEYVSDGHLSNDEKSRMYGVIDKVWDHACTQKYSNREGNGPSVGMFGTGFYTFKDKADDDSCRRFIKMLVDISKMDDDEQIYDRCELVFDDNFRGMQAASASVMLHCLKPCSFSILNNNAGSGTIYNRLGIILDRPNKIFTYIDNCRRIKAFRDSKLNVKNYRVMDCFARKLESEEAAKYFPLLEEYDPGITKEQYKNLLQDSGVVKKNSLDTLYFMYCMGGEATCTAISQKYGDTAQHYSAHGTYVAKAIQAATECPLSEREDGPDRYWSVLFLGRHLDNTHFSWKLREPLFEAIEELDEIDFFKELSVQEVQEMNTSISLNTILYGPPGTGKTYNTVIYAVAIIEDRTIEDVRKEAIVDYAAVKERYDEYKKEERVAFVTFHQSYGYEEFIEGIKPVLDNEEAENGALEYTIEAGVFKRFCERAGMPKKKNSDDYGLNNSPTVWKVSLEGTGENPTRRECLENNHIRIGWDDYGPEITEQTANLENFFGGMAPLNAFINKMKIGDIVLSCYSSTQIDAIGVVTGDYEWSGEYDYYNRLRSVRWLAKDIREDIVELNGGKTLTLSTVYKLNITPHDVLDLVKKYTESDLGSLEPSDDKYVFVIDEINRGNISKIFGELITLIEESKRRGAREETTAKLPYSRESFGVPNNVYILGTMNTADRSIAIMDTALRRRFSFVEMLPDSNVIRTMFNPVVSQNGFTVNVADMLDVINERITFLYDREHTIGHAFFMPLMKDASIETLARIFEKSIIPLLQEYFYEDYKKIQMVLGDDGKTGDNKQFQFITGDEMSAVDLFEGPVEMESETKYSINYPAFRKIESYKLIAKKL